MSFEALLADLEALQKATPPAPKSRARSRSLSGRAPSGVEGGEGGEGGEGRSLSGVEGSGVEGDDDEQIKRAASGDADDDGVPDGDDLPEQEDDEGEEPDGDEDGDGAGDGDGDEDDADADGRDMKAYDGATIIKQFHRRLMALERDLLATLQAQTGLIKSLHAQVGALQAQGRGRKTVLTVHEKPSLVPTGSKRPSPQTVLAKAMTAQRAGKLTGTDVARIESYLSRGLDVPAELTDALN